MTRSAGPSAMTETGEQERVLLAALPRRHLDSAIDVYLVNGRVTIPSGSPGDLDGATPGMNVFLMISGEHAVPAVTWRAIFVRRVAPAGVDELPDLLPGSWLHEHQADSIDGTQSFFELERLEPLSKRDWIFANELVGKQERAGRAYFPRAPRLIRPPS